MFRFAFFQCFKHQIDGILEIFVVLPNLHRVNHADQHRKVSIFFRNNTIQIADQGGIEQRFRLFPEGVVAFTLSFCIENQAVYQFQNILFAMDIRQRIIVHRLFEIDCVEYLDAVAASLKQAAALNEDAALRVSHNERTGIFVRHALHEIRFDEKSRLAAARAADNQYVFVAGIRRVLRAAAHREPFRLRQNHVVGKHGVDKGLDILRRTP